MRTRTDDQRNSEIEAALQGALSYLAGWREAVALTEDMTANPVYLKNMRAAVDQMDAFRFMAKLALKATL